ncbi:hypothetical protein F7725_004773 [Dissostichus mawsoni]|uniref:Ig-like domain-containing protein n=1 Tax=Dissostichus mawsoni TaxID=36200 RepID=A0A7J5XL78_DISMA|nr:hypothetical protein F7725_004773 [Dissostichus mawsoni]
MTIEPNWTAFFSGESVTFKCDITGGKDSSWYYSILQDGGAFLPYHKHEKYKLHSLTPGYSERPQPVLTVSPSWPSPGASVTLNCRVDHPSAGWSFYWYKAVPQKSDYSYSFELLPGSEKGLNRISSSLMDKHTQQDIFAELQEEIQCFTVGTANLSLSGLEFVPSLGQKMSLSKFVCSGGILHVLNVPSFCVSDINSAASLTVSPDSVQHFTKTPVSLSCEGNSTEWRVRMFSKPDYLYHCSILGTMIGSTCTITSYRFSGVFWCESETGQFSNAVNITMECEF